MSAQLGVVPGTGGYVDQVARWAAFKAEHPSAEYAHSAPAWTGSIMVCGQRREASRHELGWLIDELEKLAAMDADAAAIEADFSGWQVRVCCHAGFWHWEAEARKPDSRYPLGGPIVRADSADSLRTALAAFTA